MPDASGAVPARGPSRLYRLSFRVLSAVHAFFYRRGIGRSAGRHQQVLLTTTGRKSGKPKTVALGALKHGHGWIVIASFGGADAHPSWWLNLVANPQATLQVNDQVQPVRLREITDPQEYDRMWNEVISRAPQYAGYRKKTSRRIPLGFLEPIT